MKKYHINVYDEARQLVGCVFATYKESRPVYGEVTENDLLQCRRMVRSRRFEDVVGFRVSKRLYLLTPIPSALEL
jgi:hypothetical protein